MIYTNLNDTHDIYNNYSHEVVIYHELVQLLSETLLLLVNIYQQELLTDEEEELLLQAIQRSKVSIPDTKLTIASS